MWSGGFPTKCSNMFPSCWSWNHVVFIPEVALGAGGGCQRQETKAWEIRGQWFRWWWGWCLIIRAIDTVSSCFFFPSIASWMGFIYKWKQSDGSAGLQKLIAVNLLVSFFCRKTSHLPRNLWRLLLIHQLLIHQQPRFPKIPWVRLRRLPKPQVIPTRVPWLLVSELQPPSKRCYQRNLQLLRPPALLPKRVPCQRKRYLISQDRCGWMTTMCNLLVASLH